MAVKKSQLDLCSSCGKPISGESHKVANKNGNIQTFHKDARGCADAPEVKSSRTNPANNAHNSVATYLVDKNIYGGHRDGEY